MRIKNIYWYRFRKYNLQTRLCENTDSKQRKKPWHLNVNLA